MTTTKSQIDDIIKGVEDENRKDAESIKEKRQALYEARTQRAIEWIGQDIFNLLAPHITASVDFFNRDEQCEITWDIPAIPELETASMRVHYCPNYRNQSYIQVEGSNNTYKDMRIAIVAARERYFFLLKKQAQDHVNELRNKLYYNQNKDLAQAQAAAEELATLSDDLKLESEVLLTKWLEREKYERSLAIEQRREKEKREKTAKESEKTKAEHTAAIVEWFKACNEVKRHNREVEKEILSLYDAPFLVYKLTYAISARDEDGTPCNETDCIYTFQPMPDPEGFWITTTGARTKIFSPVTLEETERKPSNGIPGTVTRRFAGGVTLYFIPGILPELVDLVTRNMLSNPPYPEIPSQMDEWVARECKRAAYRDVYGEDESEY